MIKRAFPENLEMHSHTKNTEDNRSLLVNRDKGVDGPHGRLTGREVLFLAPPSSGAVGMTAVAPWIVGHTSHLPPYHNCDPAVQLCRVLKQTILSGNCAYDSKTGLQDAHSNAKVVTNGSWERSSMASNIAFILYTFMAKPTVFPTIPGAYVARNSFIKFLVLDFR